MLSSAEAACLPAGHFRLLACPATPCWISDIPHSHLIPWTLRQAGPFHLWGQPLHSEFTLFWSRPGLEARQMVRSTLLGTVQVTVLRFSLLALLAPVTLPRSVQLLSLGETDDGAHDSSVRGT